MRLAELPEAISPHRRDGRPDKQISEIVLRTQDVGINWPIDPTSDVDRGAHGARLC